MRLTQIVRFIETEIDRLGERIKEKDAEECQTGQDEEISRNSFLGSHARPTLSLDYGSFQRDWS